MADLGGAVHASCSPKVFASRFTLFSVYLARTSCRRRSAAALGISALRRRSTNPATELAGAGSAPPAAAAAAEGRGTGGREDGRENKGGSNHRQQQFEGGRLMVQK